MCGRYVLKDTDKLATRYQVSDKEEDELLQKLKENYNVAPGQNLPVIVDDGKKHVEIMRWGLIPFWAKDKKIGYKMINARAESLFEKPTWKRPITKYRCLIPASGFYEWKKEQDGKHPFYIRPKDQELFSFAGIYDTWTDKSTGEVIKSYSIITTRPNKEVSELHDRMPVILKPNDENVWLESSLDSRDVIEDFLKPYDDGMLEMYEVSRDVNVTRNNNNTLIYPINSQ